ncbi:hypothetical protein [Paractinoplanes durhamensis]|uniref:Uncharacterized protein n=1 Tax=Paractinoplanes durhamensis TaxID=113563 RepID=A0ABQ3YT20_9ACTN|nr:hypothetical protein [Actinoplanes durhamensis]GIE00720.1 hypothetical protein Adu01nite_20700 [Actinoplanes durhamensis]
MRRKLASGLAAAAAGAAVLVAGSPAQASSARYYSPDEATRIVQNFLNGAAVGSVTCGITAVVNKMKKYKARSQLNLIAAYSGEIAAKNAGTSATCKLAKQLALAAAETAAIGATGRQVWIEDLSVADRCGYISKKITFTYLIGPSPSWTLRYSGSVKVPCGT